MFSNWKLLIGRILIFLFLLFIAEFLFRLGGYKPGDLKPNWLNFQPVDSLIESRPCFVNGEGLLVADKNSFSGGGIQVNDDGFRNKDFSEIDSSKKKIMLIGDSFTWGLSAEPIDSCFADILKRETQHEVINLGIPGADTYQYLAVIEKYVPLFQPEVVLVFFFIGNDIVKKKRELVPFRPLYYYTNAGALDTEIDGVYFETAKDAYNYVVNEKYYLSEPKNIFEWIVSKSALLSKAYSVKFRIKEKVEYETRLNDLSLTTNLLSRIAAYCSAQQTKVFFIAIPEVKEASMTISEYRSKYKRLFEDSTLKHFWQVPENSKENFNDYPDAHLNNQGHRFYADQIKSLLTEL